MNTESRARAALQGVDTVPAAAWRAALDDAPFALAYVSSELRLMHVNDLFADLCERAPGELLGRFCYEVLGEHNPDGHGDELKPGPCSFCRTLECLRTGTTQRFERTLGERVLGVVSSPLKDRWGRKQGAVLMLTEAPAQQEPRRRLHETQKLAALGLMTSGVVHELKNPLTSIGGFAQLLRRRGGLPEEAMAHLERICSEARRCEHIVGSLLTFARRKDAGKTVVDINHIVREAVEFLRYQISTSGVQIHEDYHPAPLPTVGHHYDLQQVVLNIVSNAFDAMREAHRGGNLVVRTRPEDGRVVMEFENDGPPLADPDKVFAPFYTTKEIGEGTGLGLSVSLSIVRDHAGTICAMNTPRGVLFRVALRQASGDEDTVAAAPAR